MMSATSIFCVLLTTTLATLCPAQLYYFREPAHVYDAHAHYELESKAVPSIPSVAIAQPEYVAHPSVIANAQLESELPKELRKSDRFYKNPHIAAALAKESWFTDKEMPVIDRVAEKIPRDQIFKIFHDAGWIRRL